ncbi:MAG: hypothetical protein KDB80_14430 [Planctomycetes bacterium]|nr:hypothetical protein [Planctomycetota bacterium]
MSNPREIEPLRGVHFPVTGKRPDGGASPVKRREDGLERRADRVDLHAPTRIVLDLIRERILTRTREALDVDATRGSVRFVEDTDQTVRAFVSRLVSEQNMIVSERRAAWPAEELETVVQRATEAGMTEAIEILDDLGRLDAAAYQLISEVLDELQRKISVSLPPIPPHGS